MSYSMALKRSLGIVIISIFSFIYGSLYFYYGAVFMGFAGAFTSEVGGIFSAIGLLLLLLGSLLIVMAIGLLLMADWARKWGADFYGLMAGLALFVALFDPLMLLPAVTYLFFYFYLKSSKTRRSFESYGYEPPKIHEGVAKRQHAHTTTLRVESTSLAEPARETPRQSEMKIPGNMVLCPHCQTLNLKKDGACKMCATELPHD